MARGRIQRRHDAASRLRPARARAGVRARQSGVPRHTRALDRPRRRRRRAARARWPRSTCGTSPTSSPGERVAFDREWMGTLDRAMAGGPCARRFSRRSPMRPVSSRHTSRRSSTGSPTTAFARDLPGGLRAETEYAKLVVSRAGETPRAVAPSLLPIPGTADLGSAGLIVAELADPADKRDARLGDDRRRWPGPARRRRAASRGPDAPPRHGRHSQALGPAGRREGTASGPWRHSRWCATGNGSCGSRG